MLEERGIDGYVALGRDGKKLTPKAYFSPVRKRMRAKLVSDEGARRYGERKWIVEAPFGWIKQALGFRSFSLRGKSKVRSEWALVCLALNLKRLHVVMAS